MHRTLAMRVAEKAKALEIAAGFALPIEARVGSAHLVEVPGGRIAARLDSEELWLGQVERRMAGGSGFRCIGKDQDCEEVRALRS